MKPRIIALDVGDARIGVALSDPLGIFAQPLCTIANRRPGAFEEIISLAHTHGVETILLGLPLELDGRQGRQARKIQTFLENLKKAFEKQQRMPVPQFVLWDERFSTLQAERVIAGEGLKNRTRREVLDRISASLLLDAFLSSPAVSRPS